MPETVEEEFGSWELAFPMCMELNPILAACQHPALGSDNKLPYKK